MRAVGLIDFFVVMSLITAPISISALSICYLISQLIWPIYSGWHVAVGCLFIHDDHRPILAVSGSCSYTNSVYRIALYYTTYLFYSVFILVFFCMFYFLQMLKYKDGQSTVNIFIFSMCALKRSVWNTKHLKVCSSWILIMIKIRQSSGIANVCNCFC